MYLRRKWPWRMDLRCLFPAQRYWFLHWCHCFSLSVWGVGEIGFLFHHCEWLWAQAQELYIIKLFFGVDRESEGLHEVLSCLHAGKVLFQPLQASKQGQNLMSLIRMYLYLVLSTFGISTTVALQWAQQRHLPPSRTSLKFKCRAILFYCFQWNFQFLCAGLALCWLIYMKSWQDSTGINLIYLLIYMSGPSGEVLKQYQKKKT